MSLFALYVLAMLDGLLCGFRVAAGRCAPTDARAYSRKAMLRGLLWAQIAAILAAMALAVVWKLAPDRPALLADLRAAAHRMLWIFLPYAALVLGALLARAVLSNASGGKVLGRIAALRPLVTVAGVIFGIVLAARWETRLLGIFILALMMSLEPLLNRIVGLQATTS